jgi:Icc-related predicted phosphoesterase
MLLVADVHGAFDDLARVASSGEPLLVLGDLLNVIDYRTMDGMLADVGGRDLARELTDLRGRGDHDGARERWRAFVGGREAEISRHYEDLTVEAYRHMAAALRGANAYVTFGNADQPDLLAAMVPTGVRFVDGEVVDIDGVRVGIVGGGVPALGVPGEVGDGEMAAKLARLGPVDVLCTHVAPTIRQLSHDVIGGRPKESPAVMAYIRDVQPAHHYFGDIHQPQATEWRVGRTLCKNVGYFRATRRPVRHG